jgi:MerR family copper efflux transcriptional regulator
VTMALAGMNIGQASAESGVSAKMIRYYEGVSLIRPAVRTAAGYRRYDDADVQTLRFLKRARSLGFSVEQMRGLLALWRDQGRSNTEVMELALSHAAALEAKAREIVEISSALRDLARRCESSDRPGCPIIDELADGGRSGLAIEPYAAAN